METTNENIQADPKNTAIDSANRTKHVITGIAAVIAIGLVMAGWYVGGRIVAAKKAYAASAIAKPVPVGAITAKPVAVVAVPVSEPVQKATAEQAPIRTEEEKPKATSPKPGIDSRDPAKWNTVDPQSGELYLQLATMGPNSTNDYLKDLQAKGINPKIAPGPGERLYRLVLGPYSDKSAFEQEQKELQAAGVEFMPHRY
jgi:cell division septation protein DedD